MIISTNSDPDREDFDILLSSTLSELNQFALRSPDSVSSLGGRTLEPYVHELMSKLAVGTPFESSIELIGGQRFPDIIAKKYYGVEVKTTTQNHWKTTGNSVLEGTRVEGIERIFMLFAKLARPIEFKCRPYEDVLSEVVVTHSPRYLIDMNLEVGKTIFDKINIPYNQIRKESNPVRPIIDYYKSFLKPGEDIWWLDNDNRSEPNSIVISVWSNLPQEQKNELKNLGMAYFPELFGSSADKFSRFAVWLLTRRSVVCPNVRDIFTAGGRGSFNLEGVLIPDLPRIFLNLFSSIDEVFSLLNQTPSDILSEYWSRKTSDSTKLMDWISLVAERSSEHIRVDSGRIQYFLTRLAKLS